MRSNLVIFRTVGADPSLVKFTLTQLVIHQDPTPYVLRKPGEGQSLPRLLFVVRMSPLG